MTRFIARSASDRTDDWPYWMIWDTSRNLNVGSWAAEQIGDPWPRGVVLTSRNEAERIAVAINAKDNANG